MVLAVHVGGDGATDRHELRARRHRREPAAGQPSPDEVGDAHAGFAAQGTAGGVEVEDAVEPIVDDHAATRVERGVAVAAPEAARDERRGRLAREHLRHRHAALRPEDLAGLHGKAAPPAEARRRHHPVP
jgi:hypothetical protein